MYCVLCVKIFWGTKHVYHHKMKIIIIIVIIDCLCMGIMCVCVLVWFGFFLVERVRERERKRERFITFILVWGSSRATLLKSFMLLCFAFIFFLFVEFVVLLFLENPWIKILRISLNGVCECVSVCVVFLYYLVLCL